MQEFKKFYQLCVKRTKSVRVDVEQIKGELQTISAQLKRNLSDEQSLASKLSEVRSVHQSFQNRIEQASENMKAYKSFLATFNS